MYAGATGDTTDYLILHWRHMVRLKTVCMWHQCAHNVSQRWLVPVAVVSMMRETSGDHDAGDTAGRP